MSAQKFTPIHNGRAVPLKDVPELTYAEFRDEILQAHQRLACLCADEQLRLIAVLADDQGGRLFAGRTRLHKPRYPSLTPRCPQAHLFEREMAEQFGILPEGHPWLKPVRFHKPWVEDREVWKDLEPAVTDFFRVEGVEVHEVAVGPVHAGVIEPGHFRFQCHGETVLHLEIALGYQHRGIERAMVGGPHPLSMKFAETVAGDTTIGHGWAYCQLLEGLADIEVPARSQWVRGIALELERCANHTGDLGALAGDVGFLPTASFCGRIRGDWLNMSAELCGSRLGRDWLTPGGLRLDLEPEVAKALLARLDRTWKDTANAIELLWGAASVLNRFEAAGFVDHTQAQEAGLVGVAARGCGLELDVRRDHPYGPYGAHPITSGMAQSGNVHARAWVRWEDLQASHQFLAEAFEALADSTADRKPDGHVTLAPESLCVSLTEGWRGEVLHLATTDTNGRFSRYKMVDPSFHNWFGLGLALRGEQISDFPLCNKSFNLSYCGHDL